MSAWLRISRLVDALNGRVGRRVSWLSRRLHAAEKRALRVDIVSARASTRVHAGILRVRSAKVRRPLPQTA